MLEKEEGFSLYPQGSDLGPRQGASTGDKYSNFNDKKSQKHIKENENIYFLPYHYPLVARLCLFSTFICLQGIWPKAVYYLIISINRTINYSHDCI